MKRKKITIFISSIAALSISGLLLLTNKEFNYKQESDKKQEKQVDDSSLEISDIEETGNLENQIENTENQVTIEQANDDLHDDKIIVEYFETTKTDVSKTFERENVERYKESIIQAFIYLTDFIFFDYEIEGIKFSDLTEGTKQNIVQTYVEIDELIMKLYPNYKEDIGSKYNVVKNFFTEIYEAGKDKVDSNLSDDTKDSLSQANNDIKQAISSTGEVTSDIYGNVKTKVKSWYEEFKLNHQ